MVKNYEDFSLVSPNPKLKSEGFGNLYKIEIFSGEYKSPWFDDSFMNIGDAEFIENYKNHNNYSDYR